MSTLTGALATPHVLATEAGMAAFADGGNAIDAAVAACALVPLAGAISPSMALHVITDPATGMQPTGLTSVDGKAFGETILTKDDLAKKPPFTKEIEGPAIDALKDKVSNKQDIVIPIEVVVRNVAAGSMVKKFGMKEGTVLNYPLIEFYYKKNELGNPMVSENHILNMGWADPYELEEMVAQAWRINDYLSGLFTGIGIRLVDFKVEFGRLFGEYEEVYILLADEISPDNCRLWDEKTGAKLDKDLFRQDLGGMIEAYQDVAKRLGLVPETGIMQGGNVDEQIAASLGEIENELARERKLRSINKSAPTKPWK